MASIKTAYYLLFYKLYCFFKALAEEGWEHWKALIAINALGVLLVVELLIWWTLGSKVILEASGFAFALPVAALVVLFNYRFFIYRNKWKKFAEEFEKYPKQKSRLAGWLSFLFIIGVLGSLIFAFYQMSQIDWSQYR